MENRWQTTSESALLEQPCSSYPVKSTFSGTNRIVSPPAVLKIAFICIHVLLLNRLRKKETDQILETEAIKVGSSQVRADICWWFVCLHASASITAVSCICLCAQDSEIEGEAPNLSNRSSIILRAFPAPQRGAGSSLLMELVLCAQDPSRIMNSSLNNSYWGRLICFGVWQMRGVLSPAGLFSPNDWCMSWNINAGHGFHSHLL